MKRILLILSVAAMLLAGCHNDLSDDAPINGGNESKEVTLALSLSQTRTSLGEKAGDSYPAYWSEGDRVVVNGVLSETAEIDATTASMANFVVNSTLSYPYYITYPYTASTTAEKSVVNFPAEQEYTEGSFAVGSAPMCGYVESGKRATLSHLASILRFAMTAETEEVVLKQIVLSSDVAIAGTFEVNCQAGTIAPTEQSQKRIVYTLPANFALSTSEASIFYIALAAVEVGTCKIEFIDSTGEKMTATWSPNKPLSKGVVREFKPIVYAPRVSTTLQPLAVEDDSLSIYYKKIYGHVRYSDGSPIAGVAVSDGFQVVQTDSKGYYELTGVTPQSWYIYCSLPSEVEVPINEYGQPCFFKKYPSSTPQYDFTFEKLPNGKETEFVLFGLADTQPSTTAHIDRFNVQAAPEIKSYSKSLGMPCYGIVLGDMVGSKPNLMEPMRDALSKSKTGMPIFACYGNHDHILCDTSHPAFPDERNKDSYIKLQRDFEECFGPVNYSFNRGDVHIISMRNVLNTSDVSVSEYKSGLTPEQFEWLKQDLALVPKSKMVVFCVHIPILNNGTLGDGTYRKEVLTMLNEYAEAHILSGHTHYMHPYDYVWNKTGFNIYEHCIASTRQDMMESNIHRDGTPCGYNIFKIKNNKFVDWYYKGYPYGMNTRDYQIRLHRGGSVFGAEPSGGDTYGTKGYYQLPYDNGTLLANIFSSDPSWRVEVYEDGVLTGTMTSYFKATGSEYNNLVGDGTLESPRRLPDGVETSRDFWAISILYGYLGSSLGNNYNTSRTMWKYTLKNPDAKHIEVRTADRFGYEYRCDRIEDNSDLGYAFYDPQYNPVIE